MVSFADDLVVDDPLKFFDFLEEEFSEMSYGLEVILAFGFTNFCVQSHIGYLFH